MIERRSAGLFLISLVFILLGLNSALPVRAQFPDHNFELVESIPVETILDNPDLRNTPQVWQEMIAGARYSIALEHFYMSNTPHSALDTVLQALQQAVQRGVKLRVILDARMSRTYPASLTELRRIGAELRLSETFNRLDGVQHAKFMVIDTQSVFLGSQNFDWRALTQIHELGIKVSYRPLAAQFLDLFEYDWNATSTKTQLGLPYTSLFTWHTIPSSIGDPLRFYATASPINYVPAGFRWDEEALLELIGNARKSIAIQLLSYSTGEGQKSYRQIDDALRKAATRGVSIQLIIADWATASREINTLKALTSVPNISIRLTTIPEFSGGYIPFARVEHCKYCVVDDSLTWLGTSNWSKSYFYSSRNLGLVVQNKTICQRLRQVFQKSWTSPYAWELEPTKDYSPKYYRERP